MTIKQLRAFIAVARHRSFAQSAETLHMSQPALSLAIKSLEQSLGGPLFRRSTRHVDLTPEGQALLPLARRLLSEWERTEDQLKQRFRLERGRVTIAAIPSYACNALPLLLSDFRARCPAIDVTVHDVINEDVIQMVLDRRVEIGIAFEPEPSLPLRFDTLYMDRFLAVVPENTPLSSCDSVSWPELLKSPFIALQHPSAVRHMLEHRVPELAVSFECHQLSTIGRMVACGLGVSAVPSLCREQMVELGARCIPLSSPVIERAIGIMTPSKTELSSVSKNLYTSLTSSACFSGAANPVSSGRSAN